MMLSLLLPVVTGVVLTAVSPAVVVAAPAPAAAGNDASIGIPSSLFDSPDDLKNYLGQLDSFYAISGRPR